MMEGWKDGRMEGWKDGRMEGWKDGRKEGRKDGWMDGWMYGWQIYLSIYLRQSFSQHVDDWKGFSSRTCFTRMTRNMMRPFLASHRYTMPPKNSWVLWQNLGTAEYHGWLNLLHTGEASILTQPRTVYNLLVVSQPFSPLWLVNTPVAGIAGCHSASVMTLASSGEWCRIPTIPVFDFARNKATKANHMVFKPRFPTTPWFPILLMSPCLQTRKDPQKSFVFQLAGCAPGLPMSAGSTINGSLVDVMGISEMGMACSMWGSWEFKVGSWGNLAWNLAWNLGFKHEMSMCFFCIHSIAWNFTRRMSWWDPPWNPTKDSFQALTAARS